MSNLLIKMVPLVSFLAALRILTEAQSCNNGIGKLVYEKVADYRLNGLSRFGTNKAIKEVITRSELPIKVLEECIRRCQEDRLTAIQHCLSFDFSPGRRRSSPFKSPQNINSISSGQEVGQESISAEYEQSSCTLYEERGNPDGEETLVKQENAWHYNEVCLSSTKVSTQCPNRLYVFERIPSYKFEGSEDKEVVAANRTECEDKCLNEHTFPCRSASFDRKNVKCKLSKETRYMNPKGFKSDPNSDYLENMCLPRAQMCAWNAFILETGKELDGAYERVLVTAKDFQECSNICLDSLEKQGFLCRSFMFDEAGHTCILYDEDPLSYEEIGQTDQHTLQQFKSRPLKQSAGNLYRVLCVNSERDKVMNNATLECYRKQRLNGSHHIEIVTYSFYDCLQECMRRFRRFCRTVEYSSLKRQCRFSSFTKSRQNKVNLIDDANFDFYYFTWNRSAPGNSYQSVNYPQPTQYDPRIGGFGSGSGSGGYNSQFGHPSDLAYSGGSYQNAWASNQHPHQQSHHNPVPMQRDHHRGGFSYEGYDSVSRSGYAGYGASSSSARYPPASGYGAPPYPAYSSHQVSTYQTNGQSVPQQQMSSHVPTYGIPYSVGFSGSQNSLTAGSYSPPPNIDRCKFSSAAAPSAAAVAGTSRFTRIGFGARLRSQYIFKVSRAESVDQCERACAETRDFVCKSFNFRGYFPDNCELSHLDSKQFKIDNPSYFEQNTQYDYYERSDFGGASGGGAMPAISNADCMEVTQTCTPEGMEFTLKTPEGFYGRIYTYGFYDSCFYDGNGGSSSVLRISRSNGFPRCGTQQYGDAMTNIVVVQFNDFVQTSRDKKYNLTCYFSGPGEAVVTSNYLDTKTDGRYPTQIEHLPAQNILTSNVVLRILYRGTATNTIVVGDLLTFRLEARGQYRYDYYNSDIFASNVIAKDPYTGRQVHLIDSRGCPVDLYVFPELHKTPDGGLEAEFYAFKIPDSNFLVFQATVKTCRGPCEPVICTDRGRGPGSFPSWGRKKRDLSNEEDADADAPSDEDQVSVVNSTDKSDQEEVHELLRVYLSRDDIPNEETNTYDESQQIVAAKSSPRVCVAQSGYYALITAITILTSILTIASAATGVYIFRKSKLHFKETSLPSKSNVSPGNFYVPQFLPSPPLPSSTLNSHQKFEDPSEPIYTDPSLFERSRSLRSVTVSNNPSVD